MARSTLFDSYIIAMKHTPLKQTVCTMRNMAKLLLPHTYPVVPFSDEQDVLVLKQKVVVVDGYDVTVCYSEADYEEYSLKSLQIQSSRAPFLPFVLVCKIGRAFLGSRNLSYIEFFRGNKKVYCWTVKARNGRILPPGKKTEPGSYEGFEFSILHPGSVDLF